MSDDDYTASLGPFAVAILLFGLLVYSIYAGMENFGMLSVGLMVVLALGNKLINKSYKATVQNRQVQMAQQQDRR